MTQRKVQQHEDLLNLLQALCTQRGPHRYIIDGLLNYEDWYIWFDVELDDDDPKPGTCDIHIQKCGTTTKDADSGFRVVKDADFYIVLQFLRTIGITNLPEKSKKAYLDANLIINPARKEPQE